MTFERDLEVEARLSRLETTVAELKSVFDKARPQLIIINTLGSSVGGVITGLLIWYITKK